MGMIPRLAVILFVLLLNSCARVPSANGQAPAEPPSSKRVIQALLANLDVPLSSHPSCKGVGTEKQDRDLRDYLSGLLAEYTHTTGRNWITIETNPLPPGSRAAWKCRVQFDRVDGETRLGWGVDFEMRTDGTMIRESIVCTGAG
jgi:hypothetical protein